MFNIPVALEQMLLRYFNKTWDLVKLAAKESVNAKSSQLHPSNFKNTSAQFLTELTLQFALIIHGRRGTRTTKY